MRNPTFSAHLPFTAKGGGFSRYEDEHTTGRKEVWARTTHIVLICLVSCSVFFEGERAEPAPHVSFRYFTISAVTVPDLATIRIFVAPPSTELLLQSTPGIESSPPTGKFVSCMVIDIVLLGE